MSNSIVGNNANPTECFTWYEVEVDDDELPYLTRKEVEAIACFCAYVDKHK